jgi:hypothetical protein
MKASVILKIILKSLTHGSHMGNPLSDRFDRKSHSEMDNCLMDYFSMILITCSIPHTHLWRLETPLHCPLSLVVESSTRTQHALPEKRKEAYTRLSKGLGM